MLPPVLPRPPKADAEAKRMLQGMSDPVLGRHLRLLQEVHEGSAVLRRTGGAPEQRDLGRRSQRSRQHRGHPRPAHRVYLAVPHDALHH